MIAIECENLSRDFGDFKAVQNLSFQLPENECLGLLGLNGAGKTTTMRMLTTAIPASTGTAKICGFDLVSAAEKIRPIVGYLPETPPIYPELRVVEYLNFIADLRGVSRVEAVERAITMCGLNEVTKKLCGDLSKGFKQRVGIAQAIIHRPKVIILDEPTSGLDPIQILEVRKLICDLRCTATIILSTHLLNEVVETCSYYSIISKGKLIKFASLANETSLEETFIEAVRG